jgi:tetratricopeptide (TPR) repeat protein
MAGGIKREEAGSILKKMNDCRIQLQKENIYSCLMTFRDVLDKTLKTRMLPADEKQLHKEINAFQSDLASSRAFLKLYGPVTFKDDDLETALDFMKQLIQIREEEIVAAMEVSKDEGAADDTLQQRMDRIMVFIERGEGDAAREMAGKDEEAADALIEYYNESGIECRKDHDLEKAALIFGKALLLRPDDEGLYYNMARVHIDAGDWASAKTAIGQALKANPDFKEGQSLKTFIDRNLK